jgi:hypothetical protein
MKKNRNIELNVDSIGNQTPLTKSEEKLISEFIQQLKRKKVRKRTKEKENS